MSNIAIEFSHVSKQYRLGLVSTKTLSHDIRRFWITNVLHKEDPYLKIGETNDRATKGSSEYVWALRDIDFKVEQGDVVGIIGKNGAGKSTLLKLLSRVTGPTTGTIRAHGRIGSLLEVGTGFHGEMTGRENIFMNGAILGMSRAEIQSKLDEIIDFSGCERYIDTPVKRYSSGMTVRLGFAVAAFLEPEILVVDEVLAVGDAEFQKKAIGKMKDVSKTDGRTVLFVSHNMTSIRSLCNTGVLLENGMIKNIGQVDAIVSYYLKGDSEIFNYKCWDEGGSPLKGGGFEMLELGVRPRRGGYDDIIHMTDAIEVYMRYRVTEYRPDLALTLHVKNEQGNAIFSCSGARRCYPVEHNVGEYVQILTFPENFFNWGTYAIDIYVVENGAASFLRDYDLVTFTVVNKAQEIGKFMGKEPGDITPQLDFVETKIK